MLLSKKKLKELGTKQLQVGKMQVVNAARVLGLANMVEAPNEFEAVIEGGKLFVDGRYLWLFGGRAPESLADAAEPVNKTG